MENADDETIRPHQRETELPWWTSAMLRRATEPLVRSLLAFVGLTFGIAWGVTGLALAFQDAVEAVLGPMRASHPLFILAVWAPAISAILLVLWHGGLPGRRR